MIRKLLTLVVCVAVVATLVPSYVGAAGPGEATGLTEDQQYTQAMEKLQPYLSISETGNIMLDAPKGIIKSIDSEVYESFLAGLAQTNSMIDDGYLVANSDFTVVVTERFREDYSQYLEPVSDVVAEGNAITLSSTTGGITGFETYPWGCWLYLSDAWCDALVYLMGMGLPISGLIALVTGPGAIVAGVVAALCGLGIATISYFNRNNTGIAICLFLYVTVIWIGPQTEPCGVVTGYVTDHATGYAVPYSTVTATQSGQVIQEVESTSYGFYAITLSPGIYTLTASHSGYYDLGKSVAVSDDSYATRNFQLYESTGGGGCPFLYVWDGSDYVDEGLLNIHNAEGVDVTYEHALITLPEAVNGAYEFRLIEHPKTISHIDQVQLRAILEDGTVKELPLRQAWHSEDENVLNLLLKSDDRRVDEKGADHNGGTSQSIDLEFAALGPNAKAVAFVFTIEGYNMIIK